jgi:hypothetical protein
MKRLGLLAGVTVLAVAVLGWAFMQRDYDAHAQGTKAPILVYEVRSWVESEADATVWQWQAFDDGSLHVGFYSPGNLTCALVNLPAGITATYAGAGEANAVVAGPAEQINMCEAVFSRANG